MDFKEIIAISIIMIMLIFVSGIVFSITKPAGIFSLLCFGTLFLFIINDISNDIPLFPNSEKINLDDNDMTNIKDTYNICIIDTVLHNNNNQIIIKIKK